MAIIPGGFAPTFRVDFGHRSHRGSAMRESVGWEKSLGRSASHDPYKPLPPSAAKPLRPIGRLAAMWNTLAAGIPWRKSLTISTQTQAWFRTG